MHAQQMYSCVLAVVLVAGVLAAPLVEKAKEKKDAPMTPQVEKAEEQELENLVSLAGEETEGNNVAVHESHVSHTEINNGQKVKVEKEEERVTDLKTGNVLADVKQISETGKDANGEPQKMTETEVDIPDKGVHETFVNNDEEEDSAESEEMEAPSQPTVGFSPAAVAKYLLSSGDFDNFYAALNDLVASNTMSQDQAETYMEEVAAEYRALQAQQSAIEENIMSEYAPVYEEQPWKRGGMPSQIPDSFYDVDSYDGYANNGLDLASQREEEEENSLSSIIDALLNAWWEKDFEGGNERAMALVSYLEEIVSRDENPDDIGQIRDILADMLANALLEDAQFGGEEKVEVPENESSEDSSEQTSSEAAEETNEQSSEENSSAENISAPEDELEAAAHETADETPEETQTSEEAEVKETKEEKH